MKRLTVFLCGLLMLASCEDIEDARMLPKEFSIGNVTDISELTYDELENLVINNYYDPASQKEDMRRNGGLIIKGEVTAGAGESYNYAYLWFSTEESNLPGKGPNMWNAEGLECLNNNGDNPLFFHSNQRMLNSENVSTYYYELGLNSWDNEFPGFVDDCLSNDSYSQMAFSSVKKYTRPEVPYLFNCEMNGADAIAVNFQVKSKYPVLEGGICYSMTNQLPSKNDEVVYCWFDDNRDKYDLSMSAVAFPRENGAYYVRAFVVSEKGTSYSPVQKMTTKGGYVDAKVDTIMNVSEVSYSKLVSLIDPTDGYTLERMRKTGGILIHASVQELNYTYSNIGLRYATEISNDDVLVDELISYPINTDREHPLFFHVYSNTPEIKTFYYELELDVNNEWANNTIIPWKNKYTLSEAPFILDCTIYYDSVSWTIRSGSTVTQSGLCYSTSNDLPTLKDQILLDTQNDPNYGSVQYDGRLSAGTYYVRAFSTSEKGTGYSPVQKVTIY